MWHGGPAFCPVALETGTNFQPTGMTPMFLVHAGFVVPQDVPAYSWLKRKIAPPTNRYDIRPGRHWDGVDRTNGFEKDFIRHQNEKKAQEKEAMMWSMEDM